MFRERDKAHVHRFGGGQSTANPDDSRWLRVEGMQNLRLGRRARYDGSGREAGSN
jgi:hypothetical protein